MNDRRSCKVDIAVPKTHRRANLREPSPAPDPAPINRVQESSYEELAEKKGPERNPFTDCPDYNVAGGLHEDDFKEGQAEAAGIVAGPDSEKALATQEAPKPTPDQEMIERRGTP